MKHLWLLGIAALAAGLAWTGQARAESDLAVTDGFVVTLEYTLTLPDQTVADSNVGRKPFTFTQGAHEIVSGLEKALIGMKAGQSKRIEVSAVDGFGAYSMKARLTVERDRVPADVKVGMILQSAEGRPARVLEVHEKTVLLDLNHPLAGKNLLFDVKVLKVEKPAAEASGGEKP